MEAIGSPFFTVSKRPTETFVNNPARGLESMIFSERASPTTEDGLTLLNQRNHHPGDAEQKHDDRQGDLPEVLPSLFGWDGDGLFIAHMLDL